ncbi:16S rRNA (guanine(527)-N(7))-methyltransferase RsmG [Bombilactobacillus bombi]|uniref:16S rRNA (guanine(527)-N(7))-methyltransferase RsmG n=1 Tax=Bombilactobacillus bombi TaxID=1303590 RepID=UPI0015E60BE2|nr:16S rRNA (guanine(527)-N(7))-methyltransferase RsmG [Bombilactobacillus bombi]MBA1434125.1 16S rRNA (guanine(527)-N(7))-methyltransferase RsmG [Bombilactobacillus bombi]
MSPQELQASLITKNINLSAEQMQQLQQYFQLLEQTNKVMNLTKITETGAVYLKHFYDSLTPLFYDRQLLQSQTLADIGTGAGFPGIVLKIANPKLHLTLVDSLNKRLNFLQKVIDQLQLTQTKLVHARAEKFSQQPQYRQQFDYVTARAVANLPVLLELCLPAVKVGGYFIALKGAHAQTEIDSAKSALNKLGGQIERVEKLELPEDAGERQLIWVKKIQSTPKKFPRKPGIPTRSPL